MPSGKLSQDFMRWDTGMLSVTKGISTLVSEESRDS